MNADSAVFELLLNFRDFGGQACGSGRVRRDRLFRSAAHDRLTPSDLARLGALGLAVVVDLRRRSERRLAPSRRPQDFSGMVVETADEDEVAAPHERYLAGPSLTVETLRSRVLEFYRSAAFDPRHLDLFRRGIEAMAASDGPVLIHCAAGKDRTGILAALVLELLGVDRGAIMHDYLVTARNRDLVDYLTDRAVAAASQLGQSLPRPVAEILTSVDPAYLEETWTAIDARHGSLERYVGALQLAPGTVERLRARYRVAA
ncbi:tyrosine-protein phosphatase [Sphingosinicella terrae]|uniref:tyrosine-protein phosphatase n=1 Tax=Sphingosinicella terrae TaxID=2172047 RepID=UPI000E0D8A0B|nr:tyrosine-protein phosphatase [Sphingosinicella terrae]